MMHQTWSATFALPPRLVRVWPVAIGLICFSVFGCSKIAGSHGCDDATNAAKDYQKFRQDYFASPPNLSAAEADLTTMINDLQAASDHASGTDAEAQLHLDADQAISDAVQARNDINAGRPISTALAADFSAIGNDCSGNFSPLLEPTSPVRVSPRAPWPSRISTGGA